MAVAETQYKATKTWKTKYFKVNLSAFGKWMTLSVIL